MGRRGWIGIVVFLAACGRPFGAPPPASGGAGAAEAPAAGRWTERAGADGARYAVPPGWSAWAGEEAKQLQREVMGGTRALPEILRGWIASMPRPAFIALRGEALLGVWVEPAHIPPDGPATDPHFRADAERFYRQGLEGLAAMLAQDTGGRFRVAIGTPRWGERPGFLAEALFPLEIHGEGRRIPAQERFLLQTDRLIQVVAIGEAPVEEFLERTVFPGAGR